MESFSGHLSSVLVMDPQTVHAKSLIIISPFLGLRWAVFIQGSYLTKVKPNEWRRKKELSLKEKQDHILVQALLKLYLLVQTRNYESFRIN